VIETPKANKAFVFKQKGDDEEESKDEIAEEMAERA